MNPHGCDRRKPGRMPARHTGGAVRHGRAAGPAGRAPAMPRCWRGSTARAGQSAIAPCRPRGRRGAARLASADRRRAARASPARPPNPPGSPGPCPCLRCRACPSAHPGQSRCAVLAGPAVEPAGCATSSLDGPTARRPALDATVDASGAIVSGPARPDSPDARYVLPANAAGAVPQDNAIDPGHEYTLAELIDLAQSSNPRTRIAGTRRATPRWPPAWSRASTCRSWPPPP